MTRVHVQLNGLEEWPETLPLAAELERAIHATLSTADPPPSTGEISLSCVSSDRIRQLSREYLGVDEPTDVLAFDLGDPGGLLGDIYISPEVARRRAEEWSVDPAEEILRLAIHGVLHLLGHDHPSDEARFDSEMFRLQETLLRRLQG